MSRRPPTLAALIVLVAGVLGSAAPIAAATPVANPDSAVVQKNAGPASIDVLANDTTVPADTISAVSDPANGTAAIALGDRLVTYQPDADYTGEDTFTYTVLNADTTTDTSTVTIKVNAPPVAVDDPAVPACNPTASSFGGAFPIAEDWGQFPLAGACGLTGNDTDADGTVVDWVIESEPTHGTLLYVDPQFFAYTPDADFYTKAGDQVGGNWFSDTFTYRAIDNDGAVSEAASYRFWIAPINDPPILLAAPDDVTVAEDSGAYDADWSALGSPGPDNESDQAVTFVITNVNLYGLPVLFSQGPTFTADGHLTFTPAANTPGLATVTAHLKDDGGLEDYGLGSQLDVPPDDTGDEITFDIIVTSTNDAPDAVDDTTVLSEDAGATPVLVRNNDTTPDYGETLTISDTTNGTKGTVTVSEDGSGLTYTPHANATGSDTFTYTISDGNGGVDAATVRVTITAVNDAPNAINDGSSAGFSVWLNAGPIPLAVLANDTSLPDAPETLTIIAADDGALGTVVITGGGTGLTFDADQGATGIDVFQYTISDGHGGTDTATVQVTVQSDPTAPTVTIGRVWRSFTDRQTSSVSVTWSVSDSDAGPASQVVESRADGGSWVPVALAPRAFRTATIAATPGHTYEFRIKASDRALNESAWVMSRLVRS